ncbi:MAG: hypothetical protein ACRENJ_11385 [Candidatus Eiseniibacteriota bacterium]
MPRAAWSRLLVVPLALAALGLVSCFDEAGDCPTCPGLNSGRINVVVSQTGLVDSVHVRLDGGPQVTVRRNQTLTFEGLSQGAHDVTLTRWFFTNDVVNSRTSSFEILLDRGESRTVVFHNDFPLVSWAPPPGMEPAGGRRG